MEPKTREGADCLSPAGRVEQRPPTRNHPVVILATINEAALYAQPRNYHTWSQVILLLCSVWTLLSIDHSLLCWLPTENITRIVNETLWCTIKLVVRSTIATVTETGKPARKVRVRLILGRSKVSRTASVPSTQLGWASPTSKRQDTFGNIGCGQQLCMVDFAPHSCIVFRPSVHSPPQLHTKHAAPAFYYNLVWLPTEAGQSADADVASVRH